MMAWMRKKRVEILNYIIDFVRKKQDVDETELMREIMGVFWVSKTSAQRYIEDLIFIGRLKRNNTHIKIPEVGKK
jgi:hypothetical protein